MRQHLRIFGMKWKERVVMLKLLIVWLDHHITLLTIVVEVAVHICNRSTVLSDLYCINIVLELFAFHMAVKE